MSLEVIRDELGHYFKTKVRREEKDFLCLYGSSIYSEEKNQSDVDLFVATSNAIATNALVSFVKRLHVEHGRRIDEEVPFENKIQYSFAELMEAVNFRGLDYSGNKIIIPPVQKNVDFLNSQEVKLRLAFNALTTPHDIIGADLAEYYFIKERAEDAAALLAIALHNNSDFTLDSLYTSLTVDEGGNRGEMFLGYKTEYDKVETHLKTALDSALDRLKRLRIIKDIQDGYHVDIESFNPLEIMHTLTTR